MFTWMMISFAIITVYMLVRPYCTTIRRFETLILRRVQFAAGFITAKGIINIKNAVEASGGQFTTADVFSNSIFRFVLVLLNLSKRTESGIGSSRNIVLSLLATYGLYLLSSIIFFDVSFISSSCRIESLMSVVACSYVHLLLPIPSRQSPFLLDALRWKLMEISK